MQTTTMTEALPAPPERLLERASLFLDFDGTLVELADSPDAVHADDALVALMRRLGEATEGRLAIVTGRAIARIVDWFGEPGFAIAGSHGVEFRWADGRTAFPDAPTSLAAVTAAMRGFADARDDVLVETKPFGAGLHYRMAPQHEADAHALATRLAAEHGLQLQSGKMMVELRTAGGDKGSAIERLMREAPFAGSRPIFVGDDVTDEDGFRAVAALGGAGILVGEARPTAARYRLPDPVSVRAWLAQTTGMAA